MNEMTFDDPQPSANETTITEAWLSVVRDPGQFIRYWNYKGAVLSGVLRAPIFLVTYLAGRESVKLALAAAAVQFAFRFVFAGLSGALIQSFRKVEPAWKALFSILLVVPLISHVFEYLLQVGFSRITDTAEHTTAAVVRSVCVSLFSALFALFIMRRDVMIVGEAGSKSFFHDVKKIPVLIFYFVAFIPNEISAMLRRGAIVMAVLAFAAFGLFSQLVGWALTNRPFWTYGGGKELPGLMYWGVDGMLLLALATVLSSIVYEHYHRSR